MKDKCDSAWATEAARVRRYSPTFYINSVNIRKAIKRLKMRGRVLDLGCGDCSKIVGLLDEGIDYTGVDHSDVAVKKGRERGFDVYKKTATSFCFKEKFDFILSIDMLEHVKDDEKVIIQCRKNLKKDGKLVLTTVLNQRYFGPLDANAGHHRRYDPDDLLRMIERNGFEIERVTYTGFPLCHLYRKMQYFIGRGRGKAKKDAKYVPKGNKLRIAVFLLRLILPIFRIDNLFSSRRFRKRARGIIVVASIKE